MRGIAAFIGTVGLTVLVIALAALLLPACGAWSRIAPAWADWCPDDRRAAVETRLAALTVERRALEDRIAARERDLALYQCTATAPPRELAEPAAPPIDRDAWEARDVGLLEGCWDLDSQFSTTDRAGNVSVYRTWQMCFDGRGQGREEMRADSGSVCSGPVTGAFDRAGRLTIVEPANLQCSDGGFIYRLESRCTLEPDGTAACLVRQPEVDASIEVNFRRSSRSP